MIDKENVLHIERVKLNIKTMERMWLQWISIQTISESILL